MKIFGSKERIAVQAELLEPAKQFVIGHICLWADGLRIGNYEEAVLLSPIADFLRGTIRHRDRRVDAELAGLPAKQILENLKNALSGETGGESQSGDALRRSWERYRELRICPNDCEAFDGEWAVLIEQGGGESFIWHDFIDKHAREVRLAPGEYAEVVRLFLGWIDPLTEHDPSSEYFAGKTFVITGKFARLQSEIAKLIRRLGGRVEYTVNERTSYVLAGEVMEEQQQIRQAQALGIPILTEADFERLLALGNDKST
jgi:NAD-dependent DNA ligase